MKPAKVWKIGTTFKRRNKKYIETIVDIWTTRDTDDNIVKVRYVTEHGFCGQTVKDYDTVATTIAMGLIKEIV